jgi:transposase InsO family protein
MEERELIRQMARDNPSWGAPRIHGELKKLGLVVSEPTVSKYMKQIKPPSQGWTTFLKNHAREMVSIDYFTVPTALMKTLNVLLVLSHDRRKILGYEVTEAATGAWAADRVIEALDFEGAPRLLLRDQDKKFGEEFNAGLEEAGIRQVLSAYRCPWQNGYVERAIGTIRRECLDHVIVFNARHLKNVLDEYVAYYNESRTHLGIEKDCPVPRPVEKPDAGEIVALPVLGGLHHRYTRRAA